MRQRVSIEQKMRMLGIVLCVMTFPAWLAAKVAAEFPRSPIRPRGLLAAVIRLFPVPPEELPCHR